MQFYLQSTIVEKGIKISEYKYTKWDVYVGCIITDVVSYFIIFACAATIFAHGIRIETAKDAALALFPLAGDYSAWLFAFGLLNASLFAASILPLSTAYFLCEGMGWDSGLNKRFWGCTTVLPLVHSAHSHCCYFHTDTRCATADDNGPLSR